MFPERIIQGTKVLGVVALAGGLICAHSLTVEGEELAFDLTPGLDHTELLLHGSQPRITSDMFASSTSPTTWNSSEFGLLVQPEADDV